MVLTFEAGVAGTEVVLEVFRTLLSGSIEQFIRNSDDASPPSAAEDVEDGEDITPASYEAVITSHAAVDLHPAVVC